MAGQCDPCFVKKASCQLSRGKVAQRGGLPAPISTDAQKQDGETSNEHDKG